MSRLLTASHCARLKAATSCGTPRIDRSVYSWVDNRPICLYCQGVPKKARKRAKTSEIGVRDRLLDAADRLFYREGVRAVGIDRVLTEADAAKASLYQHSGWKDQIRALCLDRQSGGPRASRKASLA